MKNIFYYCIGVIILSGIGVFSVMSGITNRTTFVSLDASPTAYWEFNPVYIGIGTALILGAVLLYKHTAGKK